MFGVKYKKKKQNCITFIFHFVHENVYLLFSILFIRILLFLKICKMHIDRNNFVIKPVYLIFTLRQTLRGGSRSN